MARAEFMNQSGKNVNESANGVDQIVEDACSISRDADVTPVKSEGLAVACLLEFAKV